MAATGIVAASSWACNRCPRTKCRRGGAPAPSGADRHAQGRSEALFAPSPPREALSPVPSGPAQLPPYHIDVKTACHLSQEARAGLTEFRIPSDFGNKLFEFQKAAVKIAAHHLNKRGGAVIHLSHARVQGSTHHPGSTRVARPAPLKVLKKAGGWDAARDVKLQALLTLLTTRHPTEKVLAFSQFADTVDYLSEQLKAKGVELIVETEKSVGGQLGRPSGARFRAYERLKAYAEEVKGTLLDLPELRHAIEDIYKFPLA